MVIVLGLKARPPGLHLRSAVRAVGRLAFQRRAPVLALLELLTHASVSQVQAGADP